MKYTRIFLPLVMCGFVATLASAQSSREVVLSDYGKLPLSFEANNGQTNEHVKFLSRGHGYSLFLTGNEAMIAFEKAASQAAKQKGLSAHGLDEPQKHAAGEITALRMQLAGANASGAVGAEELPCKANYFIGNDPSKWRTDVPTYAKVKYQGVYPGIDLVYYGNQGQLEYDFVVKPGADPNAIRLRFRGTGKLRVDGNGDLLLGSVGNEVYFEKPVVYQTLGGERKEVEGRYVLAAANLVGFRLGEYDRTQPLVIDPVLSYSTYLGGNGDDVGHAIAVDSSGNAYVTGSTKSTNFPIASALQPALAGTYNVFITKLNPSGTALVYSTYLGGNSDDEGFGIAVDGSGSAYITGLAASANFPTTANAFQRALAGSPNAFITKLNPSGSALVYSTYLGGRYSDHGAAIAIDASGNAYVTGSTASDNFPTANAVQATYALNSANLPFRNPNAFVTELNATGTGLVYSTYLGGAKTTSRYAGDGGLGIAVDGAGHAYVTGQASSSDFPTANAVQPALAGLSNAFVAKFSAGGAPLVYSTFLGGQGADSGTGIAADGSGNAYVSGYTDSTNFPTVNAFQPTFGGGTYDAFVSKLNAAGSALVYSTYLGGSARDVGDAIALDATGDVYVAGFTESTNFPTANAFQPALASTMGPNAFITKLNSTGSALVYSSYLGGSSLGDEGLGIALDATRNAYVTGLTESQNFPTVNAFQSTFGGGADDAFVAKISPVGTTTLLASSMNPASFGQSVTFTATVTSQSGGTPTGTVAFQDGSTVLGSGALNASAQASFTTSSLALGNHSISGVYSGDANFAMSTSAPLSQDVSTLQSIAVLPNPASVAMGHTLQFTATGHYADGSNGNVTSAVTWSSSNTATATISNSAGSQGFATGVDAAKAAVTITASQGTISGTAQLTVTHHH